MAWNTYLLNFDTLALVLGVLSGLARLPALYIAGALGSLAGVMTSLLVTRLTGRRAGKLQAELDATRQQLEDTDLRLTQSIESLQLLFNKVDQLAVQQGRQESHPGRSGFKEAIALTRHGATTKQLVSTCGLSQGEARLVQVMYGTADTVMQRPAKPALN